MTAKEFLKSLDPERRALIEPMRKLILKHDPSVKEEVSGMMGKEMLMYNDQYGFKHALASTKAYLSFHSMVLYACKPMHTKFEKLLPKAKFQKACINFKNSEQLPLTTFEQLIGDLAKVEWPPEMMLAYIEKQKAKKKKEASKAK